MGSMNGAIRKALEQPDPPCDGCFHEQRCGMYRYACSLFYCYARLMPKATWDHGGARHPSKHMYKVIFDSDLK